jgi:hypothetical protein
VWAVAICAPIAAIISASTYGVFQVSGASVTPSSETNGPRRASA